MSSTKMNFNEGEIVYARPPNTIEYQKGRILHIRGDLYNVQFENGMEHAVIEADLQKERSSRSTTRQSTRGTRKSPSRYSRSRQSPNRRSPGRRSPARRSLSRRSPSRRSPAQSTASQSRKLPIRSTRQSKVPFPSVEASNGKDLIPRVMLHKLDVPERDNVKHESEIGDPTELLPIQYRLRESTTIRRSTRLMSNVLKTEQEHKLMMLTRNIDRAVSLPVERKSLYDISVENKERGFSVQREQDLLKTDYTGRKSQEFVAGHDKLKKDVYLVNEPQEWGGKYGSFALIFLLPLSLILPQLQCTNKKCDLSNISLSTNWRYYLDLTTFAAYCGFLILIAIFFAIPIGKRVDGQQSKTGKLQYRINAFFSIFLLISIFSMSVYQGINIHDFILEKTLQLSINGWIIGTLIALILYKSGEKVPVADLNIHASTKSAVYNFFQGRQVNPRFFHLDIKMILLRASVFGMLLINMAVLTKVGQNSKGFSFEQLDLSVVSAVLQICYVLDFVFFESSLLTTFEIVHEGTGYLLCTTHLLYPFLPTLITRFYLLNKTPLTYLSGIPIATYFVGYILYRLSNLQKDRFRKDPLHACFTKLETIPTSRGKRIITSGIWGYVRHPNYLGDIIMQWSISSIALSTNVFIHYPALCCTIALIYRALRDNARCQTRYGYSWEQYCERVKYMIFKHVF